MNLVEQLAASVGVELPRDPSPDAGMVLVMEHKTTSEDASPGSHYWQRLTLDMQISGYVSAAAALGYEVDGVLYNVLRKPLLKPYEVNGKRKVAETPREYFSRLFDDIASRPDFYYQRGRIVRLSHEIEAAQVNTWEHAQAILYARRTAAWPQSPRSCFDYNRKCEFHDVCTGVASIEDPTRYTTRDSKTHLPMLSASALGTWTACKRKYYYAYELRRRPFEKDRALQFGTRIHAALEALAKAGPGAAIVAATSGDYDHESAKAEAMIRGYIARWDAEPWQTIATEQEFVTELFDPRTGDVSQDFVLGGTMDAVVKKV